MMQDRKPRFQKVPELMSPMPAANLAGPECGAARVGAELCAARQRVGWTLAEVAANLRIRLPYLEAIEAGRLEDLPGNAYAVGFLRSYATVLGLNAAEVARRFRAEAAEVNRAPELVFPAPVPDRGVPAGAVVLLGAVIAVGSYAAWYGWSGDGPSATAAVAPVPERLASLAAPPGPAAFPPVAAATPAVVASAAVSAEPAASSALPGPPGPPRPPGPGAPALAETRAAVPAADASRLVLRVKADAWVQVRAKQGPVLLNRTLRGGETWPVPRGQQLVMTTGNAGGTELLLDGTVMPPLGAAGAVRRDVPLEPDALRQATRP